MKGEKFGTGICDGDGVGHPKKGYDGFEGVDGEVPAVGEPERGFGALFDVRRVRSSEKSGLSNGGCSRVAFFWYWNSLSDLGNITRRKTYHGGSPDPQLV